jgi:hypothetical protein
VAGLKIEYRNDILAPRNEALVLKLPADPGSPDLLTQRTWNLRFHMYSFKTGKL